MSREGKMIRLAVDLRFLDGFLEHFAINLHGSRQEPGCLLFRAARSPAEEGPDGPAIFYVWEEFADADAVAQHQASYHFRTWSAWRESLPPDAVVRSGFATVPLLGD